MVVPGGIYAAVHRRNADYAARLRVVLEKRGFPAEYVARVR